MKRSKAPIPLTTSSSLHYNTPSFLLWQVLCWRCPFASWVQAAAAGPQHTWWTSCSVTQRRHRSVPASSRPTCACEWWGILYNKHVDVKNSGKAYTILYKLRHLKSSFTALKQLRTAKTTRMRTLILIHLLPDFPLSNPDENEEKCPMLIR